ncbi:hypothetical protein A6J63_006915 [Yersinia enterocolitica]|nr:hypothetical protein A6J63_006915 [Yersinia enterocolitica]HDL8432965.1 SIR2 family protein [Yersinia enterocolitica]
MDNKCIYQGGEILDEKDYLSHISSLCQLDNVGVLLGAGASVGCGGKTMKDVWTSFNDEYPEFVSSLLEDYNLLIKNSVEENTVNIEILIDDVSKFLSVSKTRKKQNEVDFLSSVLRALYRKVTEAALLVDEDFGNQNQGENDKFNSHRELIEKLISNRLPGQAAPALFTTNYDLAIEWSAEEIGVQLINGFTGIHTRQFVPQNFDLAFRNVNAKGEARFGHYHAYLYKLHGSLTWLQNKDMNVREVSSNQAFSQYISKIIKEEAIDDEQYLIYPGANKYHHTIGFVYGEMFRRFSEFLSKPQTALFINGFGFGDYHINRIILGALLNPSLHVVIYYPELGQLDGKIVFGELSEAEKIIYRIKKMSLNQITIVGGNEMAWFNKFVSDLPKPVLFPKREGVKELADALIELTQKGK